MELAGLTGASFDAARVTLLKTASPAGTAYDGTAMLRASRAAGWQVSDASVNLPTLRTDGKPRTAYPDTAVELDRADDQARLRALVDDQPKMLARLRQAHDAVTAEILAQHKTRRRQAWWDSSGPGPFSPAPGRPHAPETEKFIWK